MGIRIITKLCRRKLISNRKKLEITWAVFFGIGTCFTIVMFYQANVKNSTILVPFPALYTRNKLGIPNYSSVTPYFSSSVKKTTETLSQKKKERRYISTLVNRSDLSNITKPWFTVFPEDLHLKSFYSFFNKRNTTVSILPKSYALDVNIACHETDTTLLILVPSVVKETKTRQDIRKTWASVCYHSKRIQKDIAKVVFFFGDSALRNEEKESLRKESTEFGDIVTIDMVDSYKNLSLKISSMLLWSKQRCPSAKFVAKVDLDTWLNIPLMIKLLENLTVFNKNNNIPASTLGFRHAFDRPAAVHSGRWEIPISLYPHNYLPRYIYGHSYVLSREAVDRVVSSLPFFPIIPNEDAFATGIMSLVANVTRVHSPAFAHLYRKQSYGDVASNKYVSSIHHKNNLMNIWNQIKSQKASNVMI